MPVDKKSFEDAMALRAKIQQQARDEKEAHPNSNFVTVLERRANSAFIDRLGYDKVVELAIRGYQADNPDG